MGRGRARRGAENPHRTRRASARPGEVAGVGDRALLRVEETGDDGDAIRHTGRVIKIIDRAKQRVLGIFRALPGGGGRLVPIDKKQLGQRTCDPAGRHRRTRRTATSSRSSVAPHGRLRPADRARRGTARLAQERARGQPDRHPRPRHPARLPAATCWPKRRRRKPADLAGREDWRELPLVTIDPADAKDHDDAVHAEPDPDPNNPGGYIVTRRHRRRRALRAAGLRARPRGADARQLGLFPRPRRADAAGAHLQRSLLAARRARTAPRSPCAWSSAPTAASARTRFHRVLMRSAAKLYYAQAQAAIDGRPDDDDRAAARRPCSSRSTPPIARSSARATSASRSTSTCPSARSC